MGVIDARLRSLVNAPEVDTIFPNNLLMATALLRWMPEYEVAEVVAAGRESLNAARDRLLVWATPKITHHRPGLVRPLIGKEHRPVVDAALWVASRGDDELRAVLEALDAHHDVPGGVPHEHAHLTNRLIASAVRWSDDHLTAPPQLLELYELLRSRDRLEAMSIEDQVGAFVVQRLIGRIGPLWVYATYDIAQAYEGNRGPAVLTSAVIAIAGTSWCLYFSSNELRWGTSFTYHERPAEPSRVGPHELASTIARLLD